MKRFGMILFALSLATSSAFADVRPVAPENLPKAVLELENLPDRPTVAQLRGAFKSRKIVNPNPEIRSNLQKGVFMKEGAKMIAAAERAFPGATWAPMGRDAANGGDLIDAFYTSIGQPGRVVRINASGTSIRGASAKSLVRMLESAGLQLVPGKMAEQPPFVLMDYTGFGTNSQSTMLTRAVYNAFARLKGDRRELVERFSTLSMGGTSNNAYEAHFDFDGFFNETFEHLMSTARMRPTISDHNRIPHQALNFIDGNAHGTFTYGNLWHNGYGDIKAQPNGTFAGAPTQLAALSTRQVMVAALVDTWEIGSSGEFRDLVVKEAKKLGYDFPLGGRRVVAPRQYSHLKLSPLPATIAELGEYIASQVSRMPSLQGNSSQELTAAGYALYALSERPVWSDARTLGLEVLRRAAKAVRAGQATERDLAPLMAKVVYYARHGNPYQRRGFFAALESDELLRRVFNDREAFQASDVIALGGQHWGDREELENIRLGLKFTTLAQFEAWVATEFENLPKLVGAGPGDATENGDHALSILGRNLWKNSPSAAVVILKAARDAYERGQITRIDLATSLVQATAEFFYASSLAQQRNLFLDLISESPALNDIFENEGPLFYSLTQRARISYGNPTHTREILLKARIKRGGDFGIVRAEISRLLKLAVDGDTAALGQIHRMADYNASEYSKKSAQVSFEVLRQANSEPFASALPESVRVDLIEIWLRVWGSKTGLRPHFARLAAETPALGELLDKANAPLSPFANSQPYPFKAIWSFDSTYNLYRRYREAGVTSQGCESILTGEGEKLSDAS